MYQKKAHKLLFALIHIYIYIYIYTYIYIYIYYAMDMELRVTKNLAAVDLKINFKSDLNYLARRLIINTPHTIRVLQSSKL